MLVTESPDWDTPKPTFSITVIKPMQNLKNHEIRVRSTIEKIVPISESDLGMDLITHDSCHTRWGAKKTPPGSKQIPKRFPKRYLGRNSKVLGRNFEGVRTKF